MILMVHEFYFIAIIKSIIKITFKNIFCQSFLELTNLNLSKINSEKEEIYKREFEGGSKKYKFKPISRITKEELFEYWSITLMLDLGIFKTIMEIKNHSNTKRKRNRFFLVQSTTKFTDDQIKRIAVCKIDERDEKVPTFKSIATTGFKIQNLEVNPSKGYNISDAVDLYKLNDSALKKLCLGLGVSRSSSNRRMVISICEAIQKDTLKSCSLVKLKNLNQDFNLPAPAQLTCEGYILALTRLYENENFELDSLLIDLSQSLRTSPPLVSDFYKKSLDVIDIHYRYLYSGGIHGYVKNWRIFAVSCLIKSYIINIYSFYMSTTSKHMKFEEFKQIFIHSIREVNLVPKSPSSNQNQNQN
ncbi:hypothetical protein DICPUDRAFT_77803 [Dictyostelium purpureum]|uniref:Uncharacterized protein n=1 Tax=Dictyostelium purpureum TaxID=5786 RepID=F0ZHP0_DICPU|nr:uncharacterized protein DICPUDRAFT_77803 [Dictyostelium purpureum]EGC36547.1 hypothetical protein DICPUDRAFT_77803 [Dictyostelium purpureum]|eukprot:XP_003286919.1 hypothetical protein DICPUDRAFT_77803 [Dictyostelium purpureum]